MSKVSLLFAALLAGLPTFAYEDLDGTWYCEQRESESPDIENGDGNADMVMTATYRFSGNNYSFTMRGEVTMDFNTTTESGENKNAKFNIQVEGVHSGSLAREGDIIKMTPSKGQKPQVDITAEVSGIPAGGLMKSMVVGPLKKEITSALKEEGSFKVISVSSRELVIESILTEKEIKKGEEPERITLTRDTPMR